MSAAADACSAIRADLALLPSGDLPPARTRALRSHLAACPRCRLEFGGFLRDRRALAGLAGPGPADPMADPAFFAALRADILGAVRQRGAAPPVLRRVSRWGTAAALFLLGVYLVPALRPPPQPRILDLPAITTDAVVPARRDPRLRDVGYYGGLLGRQRLELFYQRLTAGEGGAPVPLPVAGGVIAPAGDRDRAGDPVDGRADGRARSGR